MSNSIVEKSKQQLKQWKMFAEELEVQLALGKLEARDTFKKEQKNFSDFIQKQKAAFNKVERKEDAKTEALLSLFEKLEILLNESIPTAKRSYDAYKRNVLQAIYELEYALRENYEIVSFSTQDELEQFKAFLDAYRIQLALSDSKDQEEAKIRKVELQEKVADIRENLNKKEEFEAKINGFVDEISASMNHLKKAFSDLWE